MDVATAIHSAKQCRPIIDPIGALPEFLDRLHAAEQRVARPLPLEEKEES
jgi:hypothetical protein